MPQCCVQAGGGWVAWMLVWVLVVALVVWLVGRLFPGPRGPDPRAILKATSAEVEPDGGSDDPERAAIGGQPAPDDPSPMR